MRSSLHFFSFGTRLNHAKQLVSDPICLVNEPAERRESSRVTEEKLYFTTIKEGREDYFVEYRPPIHGFPFATLQLTYTTDVGYKQVASAMECEAGIWIDRFPVPLMVSAYDSVGDLIHLDGVREENQLLVFHAPGTKIVKCHWRLLKREEIPPDALNPHLLLEVYAKVSRKTSSELRAEAE